MADQLIIADKKLDAIYDDKGAKDDEAKAKVVEDVDEAAFYLGKLYSSTFFIDFYMPQVDAICATIKSENRDMINIPERAF